MKRESLDLVLERDSPEMKRLLDDIEVKLEQIGKEIVPDPLNAPPDYWEKFGESLSKQGNLTVEIAKLNTLVVKWLKKNS